MMYIQLPTYSEQDGEDTVIAVRMDAIIAILKEDGYCTIHTFNGEDFPVALPYDEMLERLMKFVPDDPK